MSDIALELWGHFSTTTLHHVSGLQGHAQNLTRQPAGLLPAMYSIYRCLAPPRQAGLVSPCGTLRGWRPSELIQPPQPCSGSGRRGCCQHLPPSGSQRRVWGPCSRQQQAQSNAWQDLVTQRVGCVGVWGGGSLAVRATGYTTLVILVRHSLSWQQPGCSKSSCMWALRCAADSAAMRSSSSAPHRHVRRCQRC